MLLSLYIINAILTVALVTANSSKFLSSSQPRLESTNAFDSNLVRDDGEGFACYEMALAFPHLMTLSGEFFVTLYTILGDTYSVLRLCSLLEVMTTMFSLLNMFSTKKAVHQDD